jgi:serine/threonine protein kinase
VTEFEILETIGEGTYGVVSRARDPRTGQLVAIKRVKLAAETEGFPLLALRELQGLSTLRAHENVVRLQEVATSRPSEHNRNLGDVFMVFEYVAHDLAGLLRCVTWW